jgi:hypothetical protein
MSKVDILIAVVKQATSLRAEGKIREALDCLSNAIVTLPVTHIGMSKSLFEELRFPISSLRAARAYCNVKLGLFADAQVDTAAALSLVPEDISFKLLAAHVHYVSGDFKLAAKFASEVVADCGGDDGDEDTEDLIKRASTLLKRCAIDRSFDATSPNISLSENDSYDSDVEFERTWEPLARKCNSCGKPVASLNCLVAAANTGDCTPPSSVMCGAFAKRLMDVRLASLMQGSLGHRARFHLPSVYSTLLTLHSHQYVDDAYVTDILCLQLIACCPRDKLNLQLMTAVLFGNNHQSTSTELPKATEPSSLLFADPNAHQQICASVVSKISQFATFSNKQRSAFEKMMETYQTVDLILSERGLGGKHPSGGRSFDFLTKDLMSNVTKNVFSKPMLMHNGLDRPASQQLQEQCESWGMWDVSVAAALFPLCAALFVRNCGDAVQSLFSLQRRRHHEHSEVSTTAALEREDQGETEAQHSEQIESELSRSGLTHQPPNLFQFPVSAAPCGIVAPFVHALAPLLRQYYLKRSSSDAQEFAREILSLCAPKELHGKLKTLLGDYLNMPM